MRKYEILLVDDDPFVLQSIGKNLSSEGYNVTEAESGEKAIELMKNNSFELIITDQVMGEVDGIQVLKSAKEIDPLTMIIMLTGYEMLSSVIDALRLGADDYLIKPCESEEILFRVKNCLQKLEFKRRIKLYEDILPICSVCKKIRDDTDKEPGTGSWVTLEDYMQDRAKIMISHSYCPECAEKLKEEY